MKCIVCGCTDEDCSECIEVTGRACSWFTIESMEGFPEPMAICTACIDVARAERKRRLSLKKEVRTQRQREDRRRTR